MTFDYSITKLKRVKCTNPNCMHVFKVYDRKEPVINDPGFVVKECPECHSKTGMRVWNVDYFSKGNDVVGVYEYSEESSHPNLAMVPLGECLEQAADVALHSTKDIDLSPRIPICSILGINGNFPKDECAKSKIEKDLYWARQAYLGSKNCMMGVEQMTIKVFRRKNAVRDFVLLGKRLDSERNFTTDNLVPVQYGRAPLSKRIDGLYTRDECLSILDFCLKRWTLTANEVIIAVPFIGFHYKNKRCKNQVLYFWAFLNSVLDMEKTVLLTRKTDFNRMKQYLNEQKQDETYDFKRYWGALDQLQAAADKAGAKKRKKTTEMFTDGQADRRQVYFTSSFHSKFYAGVYKDRVEVLVGSYNVHEGDILENLSFKTYTIAEFKTRYLERILPGGSLIKEYEKDNKTLYYTVKGDNMRQQVKELKDIEREIL